MTALGFPDFDNSSDETFRSLGISREDLEAIIQLQRARDATAPAPGDPAPDFDLPELDPSGGASSRRIRLSALLGKPVGLVFGSYTCPPFRSAVARLQEIADTYSDRMSFLCCASTSPRHTPRTGGRWPRTEKMESSTRPLARLANAPKQPQPAQCERDFACRWCSTTSATKPNGPTQHYQNAFTSSTQPAESPTAAASAHGCSTPKPGGQRSEHSCRDPNHSPPAESPLASGRHDRRRPARPRRIDWYSASRVTSRSATSHRRTRRPLVPSMPSDGRGPSPLAFGSLLPCTNTTFDPDRTRAPSLTGLLSLLDAGR